MATISSTAMSVSISSTATVGVMRSTADQTMTYSMAARAMTTSTLTMRQRQEPCRRWSGRRLWTAGYVDWFEPTSHRALTDADQNSTRALQKQSDAGSKLRFIHQRFDQANGLDFNSLTINFGAVIRGSGNLSTNLILQSKSLGNAGWLAAVQPSMPTTQSMSPPKLSTAQRKAVKRVILQLPPTWKLGQMLTAKNGIIWYRVSGGVHFQHPRRRPELR